MSATARFFRAHPAAILRDDRMAGSGAGGAARTASGWADDGAGTGYHRNSVDNDTWQEFTRPHDGNTCFDKNPHNNM